MSLTGTWTCQLVHTVCDRPCHRQEDRTVLFGGGNTKAGSSGLSGSLQERRLAKLVEAGKTGISMLRGREAGGRIPPEQ